MAFDSTDYFRTEPAKVYDKDNPPTRMSEAIRMAVADVEAQERAGVEYSWLDCSRCTAGAVVRQLGGGTGSWAQFGPEWMGVLHSLSVITFGWGLGESFLGLFGPRGDFNWAWTASQCPLPANDVTISVARYTADPAAFKRDMLNLADRLEAEGS